MSQLPSHSLAEPGETAWEHFAVDKAYLQRACPDCDHGMIWRPARFCGRCGGSGLITRTVPADVSLTGGPMSTDDPTAVPWSPDSPRATGAELVEMLTTPPVPWPLDEEVEQYLPQWDGDPALRRVLLGLIRSGNAADTRNLDDAHALLMFGQSGEPLARALLDTIRDEVAVALGRAPAAASGSVCWKCGQPIRDAYMLGLIDGSGRVEHPRGCPAVDVSDPPPAALPE